MYHSEINCQYFCQNFWTFCPVLLTAAKLLARPSVTSSPLMYSVVNALKNGCRDKLVKWLCNFAVMSFIGILAVSVVVVAGRRAVMTSRAAQTLLVHVLDDNFGV